MYLPSVQVSAWESQRNSAQKEEMTLINFQLKTQKVHLKSKGVRKKGNGLFWFQNISAHLAKSDSSFTQSRHQELKKQNTPTTRNKVKLENGSNNYHIQDYQWISKNKKRWNHNHSDRFLLYF